MEINTMTINEISTIVSKLEQEQAEFENATVRCGIIGPSGSGKSSLINAIAGKRIAEVGSVEQTMEPLSFSREGIEFIDLPGCGTPNWPQSTYIERLGLADLDCFIIVTADRVRESDLYLYHELAEERGIPGFLARNKVDASITAEARDNGLSEPQVLEKLRSNLSENIPSSRGEIYLVSAWHPADWDLPKLISDIASSQKSFKQDRFIASMAAWSQEALDQKRGIAEKITFRHALMSAANGLNPIIGLDVTADVAILTRMVKQINSIYGLEEEQIRFTETILPGIKSSPYWAGISQRAMKFSASYLSKTAITAALRRIGTLGAGLTSKLLAKYLPLLGYAVASGIGYKMTISFGENYCAEAESESQAILNEVISQAGREAARSKAA